MLCGVEFVFWIVAWIAPPIIICVVWLFVWCWIRVLSGKDLNSIDTNMPSMICCLHLGKESITHFSVILSSFTNQWDTLEYYIYIYLFYNHIWTLFFSSILPLFWFHCFNQTYCLILFLVKSWIKNILFSDSNIICFYWMKLKENKSHKCCLVRNIYNASF